jgi:hypothetical protein
MSNQHHASQVNPYVGLGSTAEVLRSSGSVSFTSESRRSAGSLNRYLSADAVEKVGFEVVVVAEAGAPGEHE